ncbi:MAG: FIST C-terminal domain-containing protein [Flavobacteriaceae bacterium]|nr:FIST C-terminal domain-containing protein [Flavobacteriaceae bacterium]
MNVSQAQIHRIEDLASMIFDFVPDIFFLFVSPTYPDTQKSLDLIHNQFPHTLSIGCSTAGEIIGNQVCDDSMVITAVKFNKTQIKLAQINLDEMHGDSLTAGEKAIAELQDKQLRHVFVLSDGLKVNGAELVKGLQKDVSDGISITGGLAADGADFNKTFVIQNGRILENHIVALGFYGEDLKIGFGSKGGWDSFGIERLVTKSENNVLYELDGQPALKLYQSFLGDQAKDLPSSGLLFPLSMRDDDNKKPVVRTILSIDEEKQSLTFAGNIPQGSYVRLMKANVDRIITGAEQSALVSTNSLKEPQQLAFLISCVGRRLVMKQLVEEEVEAVNDVLGNQIITTGFYSYGEIAPFDKFSPCSLHNQTMTITTFSE